jgi:hypothetical protein
MAGQKAKGSKKNRKFGRNRRSPSAMAYLIEGRYLKNLKKRLETRIRRNPNDNGAVNRLKQIDTIGCQKYINYCKKSGNKHAA